MGYCLEKLQPEIWIAEDTNCCDEPDDKKDKCDEAEELERTIVLEEASDHLDDLDAVAHRVELRLGSCGAVTVDDGDVEDAPASVHGVNGELGLYLEALGEYGEGLDKGPRERAESRHNILETVAIDPLDHEAYEVVAKAMEGSLVLLGIGAVGEAVAYSHISLAEKNGVAQRAGRVGRIRVVAIDHEVAVCLDVAEHLTNDVAFALTRLVPHDGTMLRSDFRRTVG